MINELIGVIFAKKGFEWAGELTYKKVYAYSKNTPLKFFESVNALLLRV